ncbi:MAG: sel1 repeat family protein [Muribaculaceae bacterium]|nr:sel1 repeat family protein [Muribaculaceae bacterium]
MKKLLPVILIVACIIGAIAGSRESSLDPATHDALRLLVQRAEEGDVKSIFELARLHDSGFDTIHIDTLRSSALYLEAARKGYPPAMNFIGYRYFTGEGIRKDVDSAIYWIRSAALAGDITAAANLGYMLSEGNEVEADQAEALKWITIAAEAGVRDAQLHLLELKKDEWEISGPDSALYVGTRYYLGNAPIIGVKLLETAAKSGNPKAAALLADAYSQGRGVRYDYQKSIDYLFDAAKKGDPSAQFILAELLEIFPDALQSSDDNYSSPSFWYEKAAASGISDSEAAYLLLYSLSPEETGPSKNKAQ